MFLFSNTCQHFIGFVWFTFSKATLSVSDNCVRHTILSTRDTFAYAIGPGLCKNCPVDMYMSVHVCARVSEGACTEPTYMQHEYSRILWLQQILKGRTFPMSLMTCTLACKMANVFHRPWAFYLLQGRFCKGADTTAHANVSGGHNFIMQQRPGGHLHHLKIMTLESVYLKIMLRCSSFREIKNYSSSTSASKF